MQLSLFLFILMGPCSILTQEFYKYHFIEENKTWKEAQQYCKHQHTDLAVLSDDEDVRRLLDSKNFQGEAWIGLHSDGSDYMQNSWMWSDGSSFTFRNWDSPQTSESQHDNQCALIVSTDEGKWKNDKCDAKKHFFCYEDNMVLIKKNKTWEDALNYCRENYYELVIITNSNEQQRAEGKVSKASTDHVWMGLKYSCFLDLWFWVNDKAVIYNNWGHKGGECEISGAMDTGEKKWYSQNEKNKYNFICVKW